MTWRLLRRPHPSSLWGPYRTLFKVLLKRAVSPSATPMGSKPAGVADSGNGRDIKHWERIAGLMGEEGVDDDKRHRVSQELHDMLDWVYQRAIVSACLSSPARMAWAAELNAKEIMIPRILVTGMGDYVRNEVYKTGSTGFFYGTWTFGCDRDIKLLANVMDTKEAGIHDCFVAPGGRSCSAYGSRPRLAPTFSWRSQDI